MIRKALGMGLPSIPKTVLFREECGLYNFYPDQDIAGKND
jgi:hypothetical protein